MWVDCGRTRDDAVADVMRRTRAEPAHQYAISRLGRRRIQSYATESLLPC